MEYPVLDSLVRVAGPFGAELPYAPVGAVFAVQEREELGKRIAVGAFGVRV